VSNQSYYTNGTGGSISITGNSGTTTTNTVWTNSTSMGSVTGTLIDDSRYYFEFKDEESRFANKLKDVDDSKANIRHLEIDLMNNIITVTIGYFKGSEDFVKSLTDFNFVIEHDWEDDTSSKQVLSIEEVISAKIDFSPTEINECKIEFRYGEINEL